MHITIISTRMRKAHALPAARPTITPVASSSDARGGEGGEGGWVLVRTGEAKMVILYLRHAQVRSVWGDRRARARAIEGGGVHEGWRVPALCCGPLARAGVQRSMCAPQHLGACGRVSQTIGHLLLDVRHLRRSLARDGERE